jgi:16S rRNA (guanine(527)-N(7))-methyltransferase RsmG
MSREPEEPAAPLPSERFYEILRRKAPDFSVAPGPRGFTALSVFLAELDRWRRKTNLTGALSADALAEHALEGLVGSELIANGERVIDIGSGAGFPGLPLAIVRADLSMTLLEPRGKRAAFLRHVVRTLGLKNTIVMEARIEEVGGQTYAVATTRAVGGFSGWIGQSRFLDARGLLLAWTTEADEVARELPGFELERSIPVPGSARRQIAAFRKRPP